MNGVINFYKEKGETSFQCVAKVRRLLKVKKAGHTGTLDPMAEGVLPICIGKATKLVDYIMEGKKTYRAGFVLGKVSDTLDSTGIVEETGKPLPDREAVEVAVRSFLGPILQRPPMYSALKKDGVRLYELARKGVELELEPRPVTIFAIELLDYGMGQGEIRLTCSKGTYVRSLIRDLGEALGTGALMDRLVREAAEPFRIQDAVGFAQLEEEGPEHHVVPMDEVLSGFPPIQIPEDYLQLLQNGVRIKDHRLVAKIPPGLYRGYTMEGRFLGLCAREDDHFHMKLHLV